MIPTVNEYLMSLGADQDYIGYVISLFAVGSIILAPLMGRLADKLGQGYAFWDFQKTRITTRISRIRSENIETICSLESKLFFTTICSIRILNILEVITKMSFSIFEKCSTLPRSPLKSPTHDDRYRVPW